MSLIDKCLIMLFDNVCLDNDEEEHNWIFSADQLPDEAPGMG